MRVGALQTGIRSISAGLRGPRGDGRGRQSPGEGHGGHYSVNATRYRSSVNGNHIFIHPFAAYCTWVGLTFYRQSFFLVLSNQPVVSELAPGVSDLRT